MVYAQQVRESWLRNKTMEVKRTRTDELNFIKGKSEGQWGLRFKKRFTNQRPSNDPSPNK